MNNSEKMGDSKQVYNIEKMIAQTEKMENVSVGGSRCFDFGDVVLTEYKQQAKYGEARSEAEKIQQTLDKLKADGVPNICRYLQIKRYVKDDTSFCWILQEKAKGNACTKYMKDDVETKVIAMLADYPSIKYLGTDQQLVNGATYEQIRDLLYSTYRLLDANISLEPKQKNVFYDAKNGYTHIDYLYKDNSEAEKLPWEKCVEVLNFASIALNAPLSKSVSPKVRERMKNDLRKSAKEVLPDYEKYAKWIEKDTSRFSSALTGSDEPCDIDMLNEYTDGLKKMRQAEIERDAKLVKSGRKLLINCRPSSVLESNMEFIPPKHIDTSLLDENDKFYQNSYEYEVKNAFEKEMRDEIIEKIEKDKQSDLTK